MNLQYSLKLSVPTKTVLNDKDQGVIIYSFEKEIAPGQELDLFYHVEVDHSAFPNGGPDIRIVRNGTFINNYYSYFPLIGYLSRKELSDGKTRFKYGLSFRERMPRIDDKRAHQYTYLSENANWIDFEAVVSTSLDQHAIAPGYLVKQWTQEDRRYFHYKMDQKMLNFYSFLSGKYKLKIDKWNDVNIEVYYHPSHNKNIDHMIESTKCLWIISPGTLAPTNSDNLELSSSLDTLVSPRPFPIPFLF